MLQDISPQSVADAFSCGLKQAKIDQVGLTSRSSLCHILAKINPNFPQNHSFKSLFQGQFVAAIFMGNTFSQRLQLDHKQL